MFVFALTVSFDDTSPRTARVETMMRGLPTPPPDGTATVQTPHAASSIGRWNVVARDAGAAPSWDPISQILFAGDVRLYNRPELIDTLGGAAEGLQGAPDLELARLAYLKWGEDAPLHLAGDFAFAAWHEREGRLFAARDHLGVRPLYYRRDADGIVLASDVRQILPLVERPAESASAEQILRWLMRDPGIARGTFFQGINRVPPGHGIVVDRARMNERRYWTFPAARARSRSYEETCEMLLATFKRVVRDRLESDRPIVAHSSGGFDSSTILMVADEIYRTEPDRPPLIMTSGIAPGYPCDESVYMDAVAGQVLFEGLRWNIVQECTAFPGVWRAAPALRRGPSLGPRFDLEVARERGARILISGVLGDGLWHATGIRRDMVRHGRALAAFVDIIKSRQVGRFPRLFFDAALGIFPPPIAARIARRVFNSRETRPRWMGPELERVFPGPKDDTAFDLASAGSNVSLLAWSRLTGLPIASGLEGFVNYAAYDGIELRAPYADVRLIEAVLAVPWQQREPRGSHRRTGRDALGPLLPPIFGQRGDQPSWNPVWAANARHVISASRAFIEQGPWLSAPFVDRGIARSMLRSALAGGLGPAEMEESLLVVNFAALEAWLRSLHADAPRLDAPG